MEGPGGSLGGWTEMDLVQPDSGSHISSEGLAVTQAGHHTFLNLCFRSFHRPQILTFILVEGFCRGGRAQVHSLLCLVASPQYHVCVTLRGCVWNNGLAVFIIVLYSTSSRPV